ncbi:CIR protein [Plasmodium chabaudi chabaudi]|uniref:CIR protein n=1 Tax=Plasmodium chabaudi chabaudi TaxID=31271 RepID=A0A4V0K374_PLACU|nr:CIR protein [Plasmodium chabaudi chabaudi]VTZ66922.1 CIR protein [Plasmodium chabaudi chabaudi]|eukprot:XP_016653128.1 CIR protein [Plasmodium chabaudi chabaudi]
MSKKLCGLIIGIDNGIIVKLNGSNVQIKNDTTFNDYCPNEGMKTNGECDSNIQNVNFAIIKLLTYFKSVVDDILEDNKLSEYAILWLCYKINLMSYDGIRNLNDFHNKYIKDKESDIQKMVDVEAYNIYMDFINKNQDLMNMDINGISNFYAPLKSLCNMYNKFDAKNNSCAKCSEDAKEFVEKYNQFNEDPSVIGNQSYRKILTILFNDYDNLKNKCKDSSSLPTIEQIQYSVKGSEKGSEFASSSSSITIKLIPVLLTFTIPFFLRIAYKYSLFGFGKRSQKQYLGKRLKK